jgi:Na+/H+-dicarboxylate symporter
VSYITKEVKISNQQKGFHPIELLYPRSLKHLSEKLHSHVKGRLWAKVLIGMLLGTSLGFILGPNVALVERNTSALIAEWLALPGLMFLSVIQMIVLPLIFASVIKGIAASESMRQLKRKGITLTFYFLFTTTVAITIGILLASAIKPGLYVDREIIQDTLSIPIPEESYAQNSIPPLNEIPAAIGSFLPTNIFGSMVNGELLQIVIFSLIFGVAMVTMNVTQSKPLLELLGSLQKVCMTIVKWAMVLAPFAVFGLTAKLTSQFGLETLLGIGVYALTVLLGLILLLAFYSAIVYISSRIRPLNFFRKIRDVQLLAFSTSSSAAVMPLSMKTAEENLKVRTSTAQLLIPLGASINMDGTALYQAVATIFLAQVFDIHFGFIALVLLLVTIAGASIGTPSTPGVGIVILATILSTHGIPLVGLTLLLGVDRILDMCRTAVNVTGDLTACVFVDQFVGGEKSQASMQRQEEFHEKKRAILKEDTIVERVPLSQMKSSIQ